MKEKKQICLMPTDRNWEKEWQGMPEYKQEDLSSFSSVIIHFRNQKDKDDFSKLIGQSITSKTKSIWHPKLEFLSVINKRYVDKPKILIQRRKLNEDK